MSEHQQRETAALRLLGTLQDQSAATVAELEAIAHQMKADHPAQAETIERVLRRAITRAQSMPQAVTALYLVNTQEPPEVIDGEVVEPSETPEIEEDTDG